MPENKSEHAPGYVPADDDKLVVFSNNFSSGTGVEI
jgi:hypothetical protein